MTCRRRKVLISLACFCVVGCFALLNCSLLLNNYLVVTKPLVKADAIVLMAGDDTDRLPAVVELYRQGVAQTVLLTNDGILGAWSSEYSKNLYLVEWTQLELINSGVPKDAIVKLNYTQSGTYFDAMNTREYVLEHNLGSIIILTSDYHTRRTLWSFENVFNNRPVKLGIYSSNSNYLSLAREGRVKRSIILLYEFLKLNCYKLRFGMLARIFQ